MFNTIRISMCSKMKFLFVTNEALSADLAWQLTKEGHEVRFYCHDEAEKDVGNGFFEKVEEWESHKDWADVIVFDDVGFGAKAEQLRKEGKAVFGGSTYTDKLELDREFGQEELKQAGVNVLPSWNFTSFDEAIEFVKSNPDRYVIKPSGKAQNEKELLFIGQEEDGKDLLQVLEHYKKNWSKKIKEFMIQRYAEGVEVAVGSFFNGKDFVYPINVNFEHKRLFPNELGPSTGEMGCYDDRTEVLTTRGWRLFGELTPDDELCTLNPETGEIEFQRPTALVSFEHHKKLVSISNESIDLVVTPDHNMYVKHCAAGGGGKNGFGLVKAREMEPPAAVKRSATWRGEERSTFTITSAASQQAHGTQALVSVSSGTVVQMEHWLALLGVCLAAGKTVGSNGVGQVIVSLPDASTAERVEGLLAHLPFWFRRRGLELVVEDWQLFSYLSGLGCQDERGVPQFVKELCPAQILHFLDWFARGGGAEQRGGSRVFRTMSSRLADDMQELLLKAGRVGIVRKATGPGGCLFEVEEDLEGEVTVEPGEVRTVEYRGRVYCATVSNHIMYVRRNGKPCWCGNTTMYWTRSSPIFENTLLKMKDKLVASGYVGYIDINCIANGKGIWPLEWTSRLGYPTISIQMEGVTSPWGQFIADLAQGKEAQLKTKKGYQAGVVVAIPPWPFEDEKAFRKYSEGATILFRRQGLEGIHIGEVKMEEGDWHIAGRSGYALVVTGSGATMADAIRSAYQNVKNVMIPNMFYRTDIGQRWTHDSDLLLSWGYL
jgi:phosphoribosylamine-glycine ligase